MIKERPILFSAPMVRAILDNRKTQTRRIMKHQPPDEDYQISWLINTTDPDKKHLQGKAHWINMKGKQNKESDIFFDCPYGKIGERLWVRETFAKMHDESGFGSGYMEYKASCKHPESIIWKPSIYMPRWASRILLEITNVWVERLNSISEKDCYAEGIEELDGHFDESEYCSIAKKIGACIGDSKPIFVQLWESINGQGSWDLNPWVWVVEFKRIAE